MGEWRPCWFHVGSVISHISCYTPDADSLFFRNFKFLKVVDLEFSHKLYFPSNLDLVYLRYFAAETSDLSIISSLTTCWNVETLLLDNWMETTLPVRLWEMVKLRNLHITRCIDAEEFLENSKILGSLKSFSTPYFSCVQNAELILRKMPNLRELKCEFYGIPDFQYYVLNFPTQIETLKFQEYMNRSDYSAVFPFCISAPNLKNLTINSFYLHPRRISEIGLLQNLQVLKLRNVAFGRKAWKVRDSEFPQLKVLKLHGVNFKGKWIVAEDAFPNLERLVLGTCYNLKNIPSCFGELSSLKFIEVKKCRKSVGKSARDIMETQVEDYQNAGFEVIIIDEREPLLAVTTDQALYYRHYVDDDGDEDVDDGDVSDDDDDDGDSGNDDNDDDDE